MTLSTVYDGIVTRMGALFPNHARLGDPYDIDENPDLLLKQGWALAIGPSAENTQRYATCIGSLGVNIVITFTRQFFARELDPSTKSTTEKLLLEDVQILKDDCDKNNLNLSGPNTRWLSFDGISKVRNDKFKIIQISCNVLVENFKNL